MIIGSLSYNFGFIGTEGLFCAGML